MNYTKNYQLNQWDAGDRVLREDFNEDNRKIDEALSKCGNCKVELGSYVGTGEKGEYHRNSLTFPRRPLLVYIMGENPGLFPGRAEKGMITVVTNSHLFFNWNGNTLRWYHSNYIRDQLNEEGVTYHYFALYET